jgi:putative transposase
LKEQSIRLKEFQKYFNFERPHEALGQKTPGSIYVPSTRVWSGKLKDIEYTKEFRTAKVKDCGRTSYKGKDIYVSRVLSGERVGMKETENGVEMYFDNIFLGLIVGDNLIVKRRKARIR